MNATKHGMAGQEWRALERRLLEAIAQLLAKSP